MHQKLLIGMACTHAEQLLLKLTTSHFHALNNEIANETMLKRILIPMCNENKANFNENFRTYAPDSVSHLVDKNRPVGAELFQLHFYFWSILDS